MINYIDIYNHCSSVPGCSCEHRRPRDQSQGRQIRCIGQVGHHDDEDDDYGDGGGDGDDGGGSGDIVVVVVVVLVSTDAREIRAREDRSAALDRVVTIMMKIILSTL